MLAIVTTIPAQALRDWRELLDGEVPDNWPWALAVVVAVLGIVLAALHDRHALSPLFLWADNFLVDAYTVCFWGLTANFYRRATQLVSVRIALWRAGLVVTLLLALAGGVVDHTENFWLLACVSNGTAECVKAGGLAWLGQAKWVLFGANFVLVLVWWRLAVVCENEFGERLRRIAEPEDARTELHIGTKGWPIDLNFDSKVKDSPLADKVWQPMLYALLIHRHVDATKTSPFRFSFSRAAVANFVKRRFDVELERQGPAERDVSAYLEHLFRERYFEAAGQRYRILADKKPPFLHEPPAPPDGDATTP